MLDDAAQSPDEEIELGSLIVETGAQPDAVVIWLHGLGADGSDFEPIVAQMMLPASLAVRFIFPDAPIQPVTINGGYMMRAWYDIYDEISERAKEDADGIKASATIVDLLVEQEIERGITPERIVLAGFSQGGAVALYAGLNSSQPLAGVMALSTYLPLAKEFTDGQKKAMNVFYAHGEQDGVIPIQYAESSKAQLAAGGVTVDWHAYTMEHSVCAEEILHIREWLIERLAPSA